MTRDRSPGITLTLCQQLILPLYACYSTAAATTVNFTIIISPLSRSRSQLYRHCDFILGLRLFAHKAKRLHFKFTDAFFAFFSNSKRLSSVLCCTIICIVQKLDKLILSQVFPDSKSIKALNNDLTCQNFSISSHGHIIIILNYQNFSF